MANTYVDYTATAAQTDFAFNFNYLEDSHVVVEIDGVDKTLTTDYTIVTSPSKKVVLTSGATAGQLVRVKRVSDFGTDLVDFVNGSVLNEADLDKAYQHNRYLNEEAAEGNNDSMQTVGGGTDFNAESKKIVNLATPTLSTDATNKNYVDDRVALGSTNLNAFDKSTHTGDNSNTEFTLSFTSQSTTAEAYLVTIDGVVQTPTTAYSVNTTTNKIIFTSAPPTSASIVVVPIGTTTDLAGSIAIADGSPLSVTATGSTASRTLAARFGEVVNVLDYGADNTGVECSAAILSAWSAKGNTNGTLYFPPGTYRLDNLLDLRTNYAPSGLEKHNHSIVGYGATLDFSNTTETSGSLIKFGATASNQVEENSRYTLEGFHIVGPHSGIPSASDTAATSLVGLELENAYGLNIKNVSIRHVYKGLFVKQCFPISAENLMVASSYIGTHLSTNCTFGSWVNCTFKKGRFGVVLQPHDEDSGIYGQRFDQTDVSENQVGVVIDPLDDNDPGTDSAVFNIDFAGLYMEAVHYDGVRIGRSLDETDASVRGTDRDRLVSNVRITGGMWVNSVAWGSTSAHDAVLFHNSSTNDNPTGLLIDIPVQTPTDGYSKKSQIISRIDTSIGVSSNVVETNDVIQSKIQFGGTPVNHADANALDDYEEGTYTPIVGNVTDSGTATTKTGYYTKVGRIVKASFNVVIGSSTTVGAMYISLPFAGDTTFYNATTVNLGHGTATQSGSVHHIMFNAFSTAATAVTPYAGTSAVGASNPFTWASGDTISGAITYVV